MVEAVPREQIETPSGAARELRSVAQLRMLHSLAARLNRLTDIDEIGEAITSELRTLIDYHNCRVYLLAPDGETLEPIVFRGELTEYEGETYEELVTKMGEGITGRVAETGESFYTPNALEVDFAVQIEGTSEVVESILAVPLLYGDRVTGVIVLSNLGYDEYDTQDMQLLEVLASHAAVALENARLFQREREAAETSSALLSLSQALTGAHDVSAVLSKTVGALPGILAAGPAAAYVRDPETAAFVLTYAERLDVATTDVAVDGETAARFLVSLDEPFILSRDDVSRVPDRYVLVDEPRSVLVAPIRALPRARPEPRGGLLGGGPHHPAVPVPQSPSRVDADRPGPRSAGPRPVGRPHRPAGPRGGPGCRPRGDRRHRRPQRRVPGQGA
jgi:GAF domain-containing protein